MADVVTLAEVRAHLRMPATYTQDDSMLQSIFIPAANEVVKRECGDIVPQTYDEYYNGGDFAIWLRHKPVLEVQLVEEGWGWINYELSFVEVNSVTTNETNLDPLFAYSLDLPMQGKISRRFGGNVPAPFVPGENNIHIIYTAGRASIPGNIVLAALQIIAFWYRGFEQRTMGIDHSGIAVLNTDFPHSGNDVFTPQNQGVPEWLLELLKPHRRPPIIG